MSYINSFRYLSLKCLMSIKAKWTSERYDNKMLKCHNFRLGKRVNILIDNDISNSRHREGILVERAPLVV